MVVNTTSASTLSSAAAAMGLVGIRLFSQSEIVGTDAAAAWASTVASPARKASADAETNGKASSSAGVASAPKMADAVRMPANQRKDRPAIPPALA